MNMPPPNPAGDRDDRSPEMPRLTRRKFLSAAGQLAISIPVLAGLPGPVPGLAGQPVQSPNQRRKIALIATEVWQYSHAQHFIDRCLEGYGWEGRHHRPPLELAGLYVDHFPENDLARERSQRHGVRIYPTIAEALTLGGSQLAVDGVLIIGEHGRYPRNEKGQTLYPRHRFFKEVVKVFEASHRAAPIFSDKHLSTSWPECVEMVGDSKRLGFPFMAGSSLPVTWRIPSVEMPLNAALAESVCVCYGGIDSYDIHGLETAQCMSERRRGGEAGVKSVHAIQGAKVCEWVAGEHTTRQLLFAALARSHTCKPRPGFTFSVPDLAWLQENSSGFIAYIIEHHDGFRTTLFLLNGLVQDFNYAGMLSNDRQVISCQMHLPMPPRAATLADFFNPQFHHAENLILTGQTPYPIERTLLTSGMTLFAVESLYRGQLKLATPELKIAYQPFESSAFWRS